MSILSQIVGGSSAITGYTQTAVMQTSQSVAVPPGTKRIEALLCGGGSLGGFGGLQIYEIPVTGSTIVLTVGLGTNTAVGGETSVVINGAKIAAVGGRFASGGVVGGPPFNKKLLCWSAMDEAPRTGKAAGTLSLQYSGSGTADTYLFTPLGGVPVTGYGGTNGYGTDASEGYGGSCGTDAPSTTSYPGNRGGAGASGGKGGDCSNVPSNANLGGNGGAGAGGGSGGYFTASGGAPYNASGGDGGSMAWCSVWGLTGFGAGIGGAGYSGAAAGSGGGGGGGGMLGAGAVGATGTAGGRGNGGAGGNGGGGAGGGPTNAVKGGDGFGMLRFYY